MRWDDLHHVLGIDMLFPEAGFLEAKIISHRDTENTDR
jgi:hypothetical protein